MYSHSTPTIIESSMTCEIHIDIVNAFYAIDPDQIDALDKSFGTHETLPIIRKTSSVIGFG